MHLSQLIIGIIFVIGGLTLTIVSFFAGFFLLIYSIPLLILGIIIFVNKNEDKIEKRKDLKEKAYNK